MKTIKFKLYLIYSFFLIFSVFLSCSKKEEQSDLKDKQTEITEKTDVDETDFSESDEDLLSVDYKEFYDELAPYGEWIEVTDKDIGIELKKGSASGENNHRKISYSELFGIKELYAADVSFGAFFIWKPSPNLAVSVAAGDPAPVYMPYSNGSWVYTDAGWYFKAPTPQEEIVHHHGRWVYSPALGWIWVPGRVWAPAWVEWRENDTYIAWTPIPPGIYIVNNIIITPPIIEERYFVCEKHYFCEPMVYKYMYKENKNKIMIKEWRRCDGIMVMNKTVINKGPDVIVIKNETGKDINTHKINKVKNVKDSKYTATELYTYTPAFQKVKESNKNAVTKPEKFVSYNEVKKTGEEKKDESSGEKDKEKGSEKQKDDKATGKDKEKVKGEDKSKDNNGKDDKIKKNKEIGDDSDMKDGGKNKGKEDKGSKDKDDKDKGKGKNK